MQSSNTSGRSEAMEQGEGEEDTWSWQVEGRDQPGIRGVSVSWSGGQGCPAPWRRGGGREGKTLRGRGQQGR